jgi:histidinol-phosphate aminotransferase
MADLSAVAESLFRPALRGLVPYEPGKPAEEIQRELGLERVVKLASNEGPYGPFPAALEALAQTAGDLNRYPDASAYRLRGALADRHGVRYEEVAVGAGADGLVDCLSQALLDRGDEVVCGWPSFPSYVLYAVKIGAEARKVPLRDHRYDLDALLSAVGPRTKLVYICHPNNPTGTMNTRAELDSYFEQVPPRVLTVLDQAYFEYVTDPEYPDAIEEYLKTGLRVVVIRTFSKIYGLAGLRVGYALTHERVVRELGKARRAFEVTAQAQEAALASLEGRDVTSEIERRRRLNDQGIRAVTAALHEHGLEPVTPAVGNFLYAEVGDDATALFSALLREGVVVRPLAGFGAPGAIRVTVGRPDENEVFRSALARVVSGATATG